MADKNILEEQEEYNILHKFNLETQKFNGPFDVLLHLIEDGKMEVSEVSLSDITSAYLNFLWNNIFDMELSSEFLVMAAYLIEMKSKLLLPAPQKAEEEENLEDLEGTLLRHLEEYKVFKELAAHLNDRREYYSKVRLRGFQEDPNIKRPIQLKNVNLEELLTAFSKVWEDLERRGEITEIAAEPITVGERIEEIKILLANNPAGIEFEKIFTRKTKVELIVTFLAILEMAKQRAIKIIQGEYFGSIMIWGR